MDMMFVSRLHSETTRKFHLLTNLTIYRVIRSANILYSNKVNRAHWCVGRFSIRLENRGWREPGGNRDRTGSKGLYIAKYTFGWWVRVQRIIFREGEGLGVSDGTGSNALTTLVGPGSDLSSKSSTLTEIVAPLKRIIAGRGN